MLAGGMAPVRSLRTTFSQSTGSLATAVRSTSFNTTPPAVAEVFTRALWQPAQYLSSVWRSAGSAVRGCGSFLSAEALAEVDDPPDCEAAEAPHTAQKASAAASRN